MDKFEMVQKMRQLHELLADTKMSEIYFNEYKHRINKDNNAILYVVPNSEMRQNLFRFFVDGGAVLNRTPWCANFCGQTIYVTTVEERQMGREFGHVVFIYDLDEYYGRDEEK